jgi:aryl-alcohol dehydrogenase-like predicted oxidoreductase
MEFSGGARMTAGAGRLGLGTVQFGQDYGITNSDGQVREDGVASILALAAEAGIDTIDTARLYGTSESVIGRCSPHEAMFRIVTKTPKFGDIADYDEAAAQLRAAFETSLDALERKDVYGLLLHDVNDLFGPVGRALWTAMEGLKSSGRVAKIGISIYGGAEIDRVLDEHSIDIVQVPFNAFDDRLVKGRQLDRLASAGVEIHARSLFLQGLLLAAAKDIPERFTPIRSAVEQLDSVFDAKGLSRLEGLLALAFRQSEIDRFIVGVTSTDELRAILAAVDRAEDAGRIEWQPPPLDAVYLNPARWSELS